MNFAVTQELFNEGTLIRASIQPAPMQEGFTLVFTRGNGKIEPLTHSKTKAAKIYKRYNGAIIEAKKIGFKEVSILLN